MCLPTSLRWAYMTALRELFCNRLIADVWHVALMDRHAVRFALIGRTAACITAACRPWCPPSQCHAIMMHDLIRVARASANSKLFVVTVQFRSFPRLSLNESPPGTACAGSAADSGTAAVRSLSCVVAAATDDVRRDGGVCRRDCRRLSCISLVFRAPAPVVQVVCASRHRRHGFNFKPRQRATPRSSTATV